MKLTLKRDLPLLLAALLVIWGLWYARPIGVDTLYPELEPDIIEVYLSDFNTYHHEDRRLKLTAGTEEFDDLWSEIRELRFRRSPFNVVVQALPFLEGIVDTYVKYPEVDDLDTMSISFAQDNGTDIWRSEHLKFDVDAWSYRDFDHGVTLPLMMKNGHEIGQKTDRVVRSEAERTGVEMRRFGFPPRCAPHSQMRGYADLIFGYSAAGRQLPDFVGSA